MSRKTTGQVLDWVAYRLDQTNRKKEKAKEQYHTSFQREMSHLLAVRAYVQKHRMMLRYLEANHPEVLASWSRDLVTK